MNEKLHHILVVDDDTRLRNLLVKYLDENGFATSSVKDTSEARELMAKVQFDLMIVDVMLPNEDGIEFSKFIRKSSNVPILILTAMSEADQRVRGLEAGADDYLSKPFEPKELLLRIKNILKRFGSKTIESKSCRFGNFIFSFSDYRLKKIELDEVETYIHITETEAKILFALCKDLGLVVSRDKLSSLCGKVDDRSIDVQITRLRRKIEKNPKNPYFLQTVRNKGYILYS